MQLPGIVSAIGPDQVQPPEALADHPAPSRGKTFWIRRLSLVPSRRKPAASSRQAWRADRLPALTNEECPGVLLEADFAIDGAVASCRRWRRRRRLATESR